MYYKDTTADTNNEENQLSLFELWLLAWEVCAAEVRVTIPPVLRQDNVFAYFNAKT